MGLENISEGIELVHRIAIIGTGIAGLCMAKTLLELRYKVTIFESEPDLGGV
ncbi:NAD(P)-binding protein [Parasphingorhabdus sp.]|uniref:NAD(P)-binding protein n=1 Tax=Parasphingorhabdus sp. TaxID=2709688 RepID=UPI003BAFF5E8